MSAIRAPRRSRSARKDLRSIVRDLVTAAFAESGRGGERREGAGCCLRDFDTERIVPDRGLATNDIFDTARHRPAALGADQENIAAALTDGAETTESMGGSVIRV